MAETHLHILARNAGNLSGDVRRLEARDVRAAFDGTPYGSAPGLKAVIDGRVKGRAYQVVLDGWVAVTCCSGTSQGDCARELEAVTIGGDIRHAKQAGAL